MSTVRHGLIRSRPSYSKSIYLKEISLIYSRCISPSKDRDRVCSSCCRGRCSFIEFLSYLIRDAYRCLWKKKLISKNNENIKRCIYLTYRRSKLSPFNGKMRLRFAWVHLLRVQVTSFSFRYRKTISQDWWIIARTCSVVSLQFLTINWHLMHYFTARL